MSTLPLVRFAMLSTSLFFLLGCSPKAKMARSLDSASAYFKANEHEKAMIEFQNVLQVDPANTIALEHLGLIWLERGAPMRALPCFAKIRALNPENTHAHVKLLEAALRFGKLADVRKGAKAILDRSPNQPEAIILLTEAVRSPEDDREAEAALRKFTDRSTAAFQLATANLALHRENPVAAKDALLRAAVLEPNYESLVLRAQVWLLKGEVSRAIAELERVGKVFSNLAADKYHLARAYLQNKDIDRSMASLKEAIARNPDHEAAILLLAELSLRTGDAQSVVLAMVGVRPNPRHPSAPRQMIEMR